VAPPADEPVHFKKLPHDDEGEGAMAVEDGVGDNCERTSTDLPEESLHI